MTSFASTAELAVYLNVSFATGAETNQAQAMLDQATAEMVEHMGRDITAVSNETVSLDATGDVLLLPAWPVTAVSAVTVDGTALTLPDDIKWYSDGRLYRYGGGFPCSWGFKRQSVTVIYSHGQTIPQGIKDICMGRAARLLDNPTSVANESAGNVSVNYGLPPGEIFTDEEKALMGRVPTLA